MSLVIFNIGWMRFYRGQTATDKIVNGGKYVAIHKTGGEIWNFEPRGGYMYGYVQAPKHSINVEKLGAKADASFADNVTVVFTATPTQGGQRVIGWYRNARVWCENKTIGDDRTYYARAKQDAVTLLDLDQRVLQVPHAGRSKQGFGMGRSNVRYVSRADENDKFIKLLRKYIGNPSTTNIKSSSQISPDSSPRQADPEKRMKVEQAAIEYVKAHYKGKGFGACRSVEKDNIGWDLEFTRGSVDLLVEVKGCSGPNATVELTPNEWKAMQQKKHQYRLAIVTDALGTPKLTIVSYNGSDKSWRDQNHRKIRRKLLKGGRITCE